MNNGINVVSLFDGMRCGRIALERADINVNNYYSSEINPYAIKVADANYPQDIKNKLGDVTQIDFSELNNIDMLIGGSPCQGFSFAGKQKGMVTKENIEIISLDQYLKLKEDGFEFEGQSYLFWEFVNALKTLRPKYWLLENVNISKKWLPIINETLGVSPIKINSKIVSPQLRGRMYWTNIPSVEIPIDKGITLTSIIEDGITDKEKAYCLTLHRGNLRDYFKKSQTTVVYLPDIDGEYEVADGKISMTFPKGKDPNELFTFKTKVPDGRYNFRMLSPEECEMCQTVPVGYTDVDGVSMAQRCDMLGNGWTIDVIAHILSYLPGNWKIN